MARERAWGERVSDRIGSPRAVTLIVLGRLIFATLALEALPLWGQRQDGELLDIYSIGLVEAASEVERQWGWIRPSPLDSDVATDYKNLVVDSYSSVEADYPRSAEGRHFEYLTDAQLLAKRKHLGKQFSVLRISPARVRGSRVWVRVDQDRIGVRKGHLVRLISAWATVYFRLDPETGEFKVDEVRLDGI